MSNRHLLQTMADAQPPSTAQEMAQQWAKERAAAQRAWEFALLYPVLTGESYVGSICPRQPAEAPLKRLERLKEEFGAP